MDSLLELVRARRAELEAAAALGRDDEEAQRLEASFIDFVEAAWPAIDPAEYQRCWAIDGLCEHLQAVVNGDPPAGSASPCRLPRDRPAGRRRAFPGWCRRSAHDASDGRYR